MQNAFCYKFSEDLLVFFTTFKLLLFPDVIFLKEGFFYSTKWILLLSKRSCCFLLSAGYPRAKRENTSTFSGSFRISWTNAIRSLSGVNSDPHAAKSQCIRFQPDILLCDRHIDLCHILNRQSLFPIYRNDHNRCTCCTS